MELLVVLLLTIFFIAVRSRLSVERPGGLQHTMEGINGFIENLAQRDHRPSFGEVRSVSDRAGNVYLVVQPDWAGAGTGIADDRGNRAAGLRPADLVLLPLFTACASNGVIGYLKHFIGPQERNAAGGADFPAVHYFSD